MQKRYKVEGMNCGGCVSSVEKAVKAVAGDAAVNVDLQSGLVTVNGICEESEIRTAVEDAGFTFSGLAD